ncbi:hypothetical protein F5X99DRAFT_412959 [Biscogniauxia marginata]|nr:hypothetical protein F5X99DRAFT_412959 [Biscogniauxia marginata]
MKLPSPLLSRVLLVAPGALAGLTVDVENQYSIKKEAALAAKNHMSFYTGDTTKDNQSFWALWLDLAQTVLNEQSARLITSRDWEGALRWQIFTLNNGYNYVNSTRWSRMVSACALRS